MSGGGGGDGGGGVPRRVWVLGGLIKLAYLHADIRTDVEVHVVAAVRGKELIDLRLVVSRQPLHQIDKLLNVRLNRGAMNHI